MVLTFVWIRGLNAEPGRIFEFALKRAVFAAKWAGVVLVATFLLIHLPLLISYAWITQQTDFTSAVVQYIEQTARPLIALGLVLFCSMQITLILHNETLREAVLGARATRPKVLAPDFLVPDRGRSPLIRYQLVE